MSAADDRVLELTEAQEELKITRTLFKSLHGGIVTGEYIQCFFSYLNQIKVDGAVALEGLMTYDSTQGNFVLYC